MNSTVEGGGRCNQRLWAGSSALVLAVLLTACAPMHRSAPAPIYTPSPTAPVGADPESVTDDPRREAEAGQTYETAPVESSSGSAGKAVDSLLQEAWGHYHRDDFDRTIAVAERAQRLDPRAAEVYLVLASAYLAQGKDQLSGQFARRGISYSAAGSVLRQRLQAVMAQLSP